MKISIDLRTALTGFQHLTIEEHGFHELGKLLVGPSLSGKACRLTLEYEPRFEQLVHA